MSKATIVIECDDQPCGSVDIRVEAEDGQETSPAARLAVALCDKIERDCAEVD